MSAGTKTPSEMRPRDVFLAALALSSPGERAAYLESVCRSDAVLRLKVEALLAEHEQIGTFLDTPVLGDVLPREGAPRSAGARTRIGGLIESVGSTIGRYKLLQEIGEGGCGSVYMAEQEQPVRRRVALKLIKPGMDTRAVIARFEAERQALALMDHPNIAKVLDAGTTENGRPYFVMELVRGIRITQFCDENNLTTRERLELFIKVCHAIQHAHQKGIIHRDIKPSNILVTLHDGVPVPKVIDFGIAKAVEQPLTDKTVFTAFEQFMGTPAYMSPEQAEMSGLDVDTRSDIYSLGVLLYELLTGKTPFDGKELVESGLEAMRRTIREREPMAPSTRLRTLPMADATDLVKYRREELGNLVKSVRGDLDWIVMKAIAKDRTLRFETANALANDVQRYLAQEPVTARPPSASYRLQKFVGRNRVLVSTGVTVLLILLGAAIISTWLAVRATMAEHEQRTQARLARMAEKNEQKQHQRAEAERLTALHRAYNSDMNLLSQALEANNYGQVVALLDRHRPKLSPELRNRRSDPDRDLRQWEWRYFWHQAQSDAAFALPRQSNSVLSLAISRDGQYLVSADRRGAVKLWDLFRRRELAVLREVRFGPGGEGRPGGGSVRFAFSPASDRLAILASDRFRETVIDVFACGTRERIKQTTLRGGIQALAFSADGARLLLLSDDQTVKTWDLAEDAPSLANGPESGRRGGFSRMMSAVFSPDGSRVALGEGGLVRVLNTQTGKEMSRLSPFETAVASMAFSPDAELLAVGPLFTEVETPIKVYATSTGEEKATLVGHVSWVPGLTFSPDGKRLASAGADQAVRIWDVAETNEVAVLRGHQSEVNCVAMAPDGRTIVSGCKDGTLFGWDAGRSEGRRPFETLPPEVVSLEFVPDGQGMLSVNRDGTVALWDTSTLLERERLSALGDHVERIVISRDGDRLYAGCGFEGIKVLDWKTRTLVPPAGRKPEGVPLKLIDHDRQLLISGPGSSLRLWNTVTGEERVLKGQSGGLAPRPGPSASRGSASLSPERKEPSGEPRPAKGRGGKQGPNFFFRVVFAVSPDEKWLALATAERTVEMINLENGQIEATLSMESWGASGLSFSRDGSVLAASSVEGTITLWDVAARSPIDVLRGHLLGVNDVVFSPDGFRLASASAKTDEAVKLWDPNSRHEVATLAGDGTLFNQVRFSPDGVLLVAINGQGKAHIWRAPALEQIDKVAQSRH